MRNLANNWYVCTLTCYKVFLLFVLSTKVWNKWNFNRNRKCSLFLGGHLGFCPPEKNARLFQRDTGSYFHLNCSKRSKSMRNRPLERVVTKTWILTGLYHKQWGHFYPRSGTFKSRNPEHDNPVHLQTTNNPVWVAPCGLSKHQASDCNWWL